MKKSSWTISDSLDVIWISKVIANNKKVCIICWILTHIDDQNDDNVIDCPSDILEEHVDNDKLWRWWQWLIHLLITNNSTTLLDPALPS